MNRWGIPKSLELEVLARDRHCVYCSVLMLDTVARGESRKCVATWEHIVNDASIVTRENIARCCNACNASKGGKSLADWLKSAYCGRHNITAASVADIIKCALKGVSTNQ